MKTSNFFALPILAMGLVLGGCSGASNTAAAGIPDAGPEAATEGATPEAGPEPTGDAGLPATDASGVPDAVSPFATAPHLAWPAIPNHGGHMLDPLRIVTVVAEDDPYASELQLFGDSIPASAWSRRGHPSTG